MRIQILFLFFTCQLFCQTTSFDKLFNEFDRYDYDEVKKTLASIDENKIILYSVSDSVRFSLYNLIKYQSTAIKKLRKDSTAITNYQIHLNYLINKGLEDYITYFMIHFSYTYAYNEKNYFSCLKYLNKSIEVEKKGLNKSHVTSVLNLFNAYDWRNRIRTVNDPDYKDEDLKLLILHYEKNEALSNLFGREQIFKDYYNASKSEFLNKEFRFSALKKTFDYGNQLKLLPQGYSYRNLFLSLRVQKIKNFIFLKFINKNFKDLISPLEFLINRCYIENYSVSSFKELKHEINKSLDQNIALNADEVIDIKFVFGGFYSKIKKKLQKKLLKPDLSFWSDVFKLRYNFHKVYGSKFDLIFSIGNIFQLIKEYRNLSDFDIENLKLEEHNLVYDIIKNEKTNSEIGVDRITPFQFISMIKTRSSLIHYPNWSEKEIEEDIMALFNSYKKTITYEELIWTLELYWQYASKIKNYKIKGSKTDAILNETKIFIVNELNPQISDTDLNLRISLSNLEELKTLKNTIEVLYKQKIINENRYKNLNLTVLQRKDILKNTYESAFAYYKYIIDNIDEEGFETSIWPAMGSARVYKFKYKLVELSNYLLKNHDKFYRNQTEFIKYSFQLMSAHFYRYIKNYDRALMGFINARANPYHWNREIISYEDMVLDNDVLYEIFEIYFFKKNIEKARDYLDTYIRQYENLEEGLKNNKSFVRFDKDMFIEIKRKSLDMKRRLLVLESKHQKSEIIIEEMIALEEKKSFYGKFNLSMLKLNTQILQNKYSNHIFLKKLDSLYNLYNVEFDSEYYGLKKDLGEFSEQYLNSKLVALKTELKNIDIINELSYENQINMMVDIGLKMSALENEVHSRIIDSKQTNEILNYKLKVDDLDRYNSILLNLNEKNSDMYFELLNKRYYEKDYDKLQLIKTEFDVFQQNIKTEFKKSEKIDIVSFQNKLQSNQAYIRFSKLNKLVFVAHLITKDQAQIIKISETDLGKLINFYTSQITNKKLDIYSYDLLFKPIVDKLSPSINQLFIKNDGLFTNVNIESLWNPIKKKYLFDIYEINYVERPSAIFKINTTSDFESAFLFGNPDFSDGNTTLETINSKVRAGINPLPYTEKEITALNILLTERDIKTVTTNLESSTEESLYANTKSSIIHLATHGFFIEGNKYDRFNWGLLAANSKSNIQNDFQKKIRNDGIIFGSEIIKKNFTQTELVVLSACETGFGNSTFFGGENLANSFLRAGAKNIISTLWPVDDKITKEFMLLFYQELLKNNNINTSLRNTKQIIKKKYGYPNYWAPFILLQNKI